MSQPTQRPVVFFDVNIGETPAGRMKMELYNDIVPKSVLEILNHITYSNNCVQNC